jgi:heme-degrading monooxygenase HmoA
MITTVFRSRLRAEGSEEFLALADRMLEIARSMPGFVSYTNFRSADGERASIIEFESAEALQAWRAHPEHAAAQQKGRESYYEEYSSKIFGAPIRESHFER